MEMSCLAPAAPSIPARAFTAATDVRQPMNLSSRHLQHIVYIIIIIIKEDGSARLEESDLHPISLKTPAQQ